MANAKEKNKLNIKGKFYCTDSNDEEGEGCIACGLCYAMVPDFFKEDKDGYAYVYVQPESDDDIIVCDDILQSCPVGSIGNDS